MLFLEPNATCPIGSPPALPVTTGEGETSILPSLEDDLSYNSVPFAVVGKATVRYSKGEDSSPIPYPVEAE